MALTAVQRKELLTRLIVKANSGQIDGDKFLDDLLAALGTSFDTQLTTEATQFVADLTATKATADAQSAEIDAKLLDLSTATTQ